MKTYQLYLELIWYFQPLENLQKEAIYLQFRTLKLEDIGAVEEKDNFIFVNYSIA